MKTILFLSVFWPMLIWAETSGQKSLGAHMDEMNSQLKSLRRMGEADWAGKVDTVHRAQEELLACLSLVPESLEAEADKSEKAKQLVAYRKLIIESYALLCDLELAFLEKSADRAGEVMAQLKTMKKEGHNQFIEE